jgi:3'-phosphoadenosine 5'-phosphosulfate sulfotransferase (PAPS reductase)/FAD synthetase
VSFSGGKDSTVLLDIARNLYPDIEAVFVDTGLEYPEILDFVKSVENITWLKPKMSFLEVINKYGYPLVSKEQSQYIHQYKVAKSEKTKETRWSGNKYGRGKISEKWKPLAFTDFKISDNCCNVMKKNPAKQHEKKTGKHPIIGTMASESSKRKQDWMKFNCNAFEAKRPTCKPLSFWNESDIWEYIKLKNISYSKIYDMGYNRTGCMFCAYGLHLQKNPNKFELMKTTHPKIYKYCMDNLKLKEMIEFMNENCKCDIKY